MNDAASPGGTGGSSSSDETITALGKELQRHATEKKIRETVEETDSLGTTVRFTETLAEAKAEAPEGTEKEVMPDGRYKSHITRLSGPGHSTTTWYYPRDSQAWKDVYDSYQSIVDNVIKCGQYDDSGLLMPMLHLDSVLRGLDPGTNLADQAEEITTSKTEDLIANLPSYFDGGSDWALASTANEALTSWEGYAAEMFRLGYLARIPTVLVGQLVVTKVLRGTLEIVYTTYKAARQDGESLAQAGIEALDGQGTDIDTVSSKELYAAAHAATMIAAVGAFIPGGQAVAATLAGIAATLSVAAYAKKQAEDKGGGSSKPTFTLDADGLMDQVNKEAGKVHDAVTEVQDKSKTWLDSVYELATSTAPAKVKVTPLTSDTGGSVSLTTREAYFEIKTPRLAKLEQKDGDPGYGQLRDDEVLGTPPDTGAQLAGDLKALWNVGNTWLPTLAGNYDALAADAESAEEGTAGALNPPGVMTDSWTKLHNELVTIFKGSSANLNSVGELLKLATEAYADADTAAKEELIASYEGDLPWE